MAALSPVPSMFARRCLLSVSAALLAAVPTLASAAFDAPSDFLASMQQSKQAMNFIHEMHLQMPSENIWASLWMNGSSRSLTPTTPEATVRFTLDVVAPKTKVRGKAEVRVFNDKAYLHLDSVDGTYADELIEAAAQLKGPKWFMTSLNMNELDVSQTEEMTDHMATVLDAAFSLERQGTTTYVLRLKPTAAADIAAAIAEESYGFGPSEEEIRQMIGDASIELRIETAGDDIRAMWYSFRVNVPDMQGATVTGKGSASVHAGSYAVTAPAGAVDIEQLFGTFALPTIPYHDLPPVIDENDWTDEWEEPVWEGPSVPMMGDGCGSDDPLERLTATRRGLCGAPSQSPRRAERRSFQQQ